MNYLSLYRKWRPQTFDDVVGQKHVVRTLSNALEQGRVAHAYIFCGPRGTGKTTVARLLAKGVNCANGPTASPCNACPSCRRVTDGVSVDVIEIDGASNRGIDEIRDVRENVKFSPTEGRFKVYLIDEVHMLTKEAFNSLLKVVEEPPSHVMFMFATTEPHKIPNTILSRCQRYDFRRFSVGEISRRLHQVAEGERFAVTEEALTLVARHAEGGMRDALGILEQCVAFEDGAEVTAATVMQILGVASREHLVGFLDLVSEQNVLDAFALIKDLQDSGKDLHQFVQDLIMYVRDLMVLKAVKDPKELLYGSEEELTAGRQQAGKFSLDMLLMMLEILDRTDGEMRHNSQTRLPLETGFVRLTQVKERVLKDAEDGDDTGLPPEIESRMQSLEQQIAELKQALDDLSVTPAVRSKQDSPGLEPAGVKTPDVGHDERGLSGGTSSPPKPAATSLEETPAQAVPIVNIKSVRDRWPQVLAALRDGRHIQAQAFAMEGKPTAVRGNTIILSFPPERSFHRANVDQEPVRKAVVATLCRILEAQVDIETQIGDPDKVTEDTPLPGTTPSVDTAEKHSEAPQAFRPPIQQDSLNVRETGTSRQLSSREGGAGQHPSSPQTPETPASGPGQRAVPPAQESIDLDEATVDDPIVKAAMRLFDAKVVRIEKVNPETNGKEE